MSNTRRTLFLAFSLACLVSIGACVVMNIAREQQITWSAQCVLAILFGWLALSPAFAKKYGLTLSLIAFSLFVGPFLFFLEKVTKVGGWFSPLGLPLAITVVASIWVVYSIFSLPWFNLWFKFSAAVLVVGAIAGTIVRHYVNAYFGTESGFLHVFVGIASCVVVSVFLGYMGYRAQKNAYEYRMRIRSTRPEGASEDGETSG